jgi:integrase
LFLAIFVLILTITGTKWGLFNNLNTQNMANFTYKEPYLYKDKKENKKWCIRYSIKYDGDDKFTPIKEYGEYYDIQLNKIKDLKERDKAARRLLTLVEDELADGVDIKKPETVIAFVKKQTEDKKKYTFDYCLDFYLKQKGYVNPIPKKEKSAQILSMFLKNMFRPFLEKNNLLDDMRVIQKSHLLDFLNSYFLSADPWSNNTYNSKKSYLGSFFSLLTEEDIIESNPVLKIKSKPKSKNKRFGVFTKEERDLLFNYLHQNSYTISVICKTIYYSYIRFSEIERLTVEDFNLITKKIRVDADKAKTQNDKLDRYVSIRTPLADTLTEYLSRFDSEPTWYMFGKDKKPSAIKIGKGWQINFTEAITHLRSEHPKLFKGTNLTPYALKHSGVSHFIEDNIKTSSHLTLLKFVKDQCRHSDFAETETYWQQLGFSTETVDKFIES